jgi:hypothetical protein
LFNLNLFFFFYLKPNIKFQKSNPRREEVQKAIRKDDAGGYENGGGEGGNAPKSGHYILPATTKGN